MLPPALTRAGPGGAGRAGHSCWVSQRWAGTHTGARAAGTQAAPPLGPRSIGGVSACASTVPNAGGRGQRVSAGFAPQHF